MCELIDAFLFEYRVASMECLQSVLVSCGGFLNISTRSLIDSTVLSGLVEMEKGNAVLSSSAATIGMLELSLCCITTPWNDGSMTSLYNSTVRVARRCENNVDANVCKSAKSLLMVCNSVLVPRAPALLYVSRANVSQQHEEPAEAPARAAPDLVNDLEKARAEILRAQRAEEELKKKKAEEKRRRQTGEAEEEIRKRKKLEPPPQPKKHTAKPSKSKASKKDAIVESKTKEMETEPDQPMEPLVDEKLESPEPVSQQEVKSMKDDKSHNTVPLSDKEDTPMEEADDDDFDFPDIVEGGGPDSDDE